MEEAVQRTQGRERWSAGLCLVIDGGAVGKLLPVCVVCFLRDIFLDSNCPFHLMLYYCLFEYLSLLFECLYFSLQALITKIIQQCCKLEL